ncbi:MAG: adenylate/guanylate cyclase domain-containing protein [Myxococcota bacterium]
MTRSWPRLAPWAALVLALGVAALTAVQRTTLERGTWTETDFGFLDMWTRMAPPRPVPDALVVVAIDDATLEAAPELLERRAGMASLLEAIQGAGARVVAIDLFFAAPEQLLPGPLTTDLAAWVEDPEPDTPPRASDLLRRSHDETTGDDHLEAALAGTNAILAAHFGLTGNLPAEDRSLTRGTFAQVVAGEALPESEPRMVASLPRFNLAAKRLGVITFEDDFGGVRRIPLVRRSGPRHFVPFAFQALAAYEGTNRGKMAFLGTEGTVVLGDRRIEGDGSDVWLSWRPVHDFHTVSAIDVLRGTAGDALRDRLVLVGFSHLSHDTVGTPWGPVPGVYLHTVAIENAMSGRWLVRAPAWADALLTGLLGGLVALAFAVPGVRTTGRLATIGLGLAVAVGVPGLLRVTQDVWVGSFGPLLGVLLPGAAAASVAWLQEGAQARELRSMFAHYVSDDLVDAMVRDPSLVKLRGDRRELTVLFSDIRDFTSFSEQLPPLELVGFLNAYLTPMTRAVLDHRGFVDKFIGDAVMALWGAPLADPAHAVNACRSALAMFRALDEVRPEAERHGIDLAIGVGINTGEVAVGNMGSAERFEYTVLGDAVNLASRLEGLTKTYGVFCILGPATARALPDTFDVRRLDLVRVKGKAAPVEIFELCGEAGTTVARYEDRPGWDAAIDAFRTGDLATARARFTAFASLNPADTVCRLYLERLGDLGAEAPAGWDGVFTHTRK